MKKGLWRARKRYNNLGISMPEFGYLAQFRPRDSASPALLWLTENGPMGGGNLRTGPNHKRERSAL